MLIPALGELTTQLDTDASGIAWTLTAYLLAAAVATPVFGRLGDMFGKRRLLVISLALFAAGSAVSALGTLARGRRRRPRRCRAPGGGIFPLCFGIIRDEFPRERVALEHRPDLRDLRHRRRRRPDPRRPDRRPRSPTTGSSGSARSAPRSPRSPTAAAGPRVAGAHARAASTCAARSCSASASCCRCSRSRAPTTGAGAAPRTLGLIARRRRGPRRLGRGRAPHRAAARRHPDAAASRPC